MLGPDVGPKSFSKLAEKLGPAWELEVGDAVSHDAENGVLVMGEEERGVMR